MDRKHVIICNLIELRDQNKNMSFKYKAYAKVIKQIEKIKTPVTSMDDLAHVEGIGKSIREKLEEILNKQADNLMDEGDNKQAFKKVEKCIEQNDGDSSKQAVVKELLRVPGIGEVRAVKLYTEHGIKSIDDLKEHTDLLTAAQKVGLCHFEDAEKRIPKKEMDRHYLFIKELLTNVDPDLVFEITGSYRRGAQDSGDIDVLITTKNSEHDIEFANIIESFKKSKYIRDDIAFGNKKYMGFCKLPKFRTYRRIDILMTTPNVFPFALLYFTGSQKHNIQMRKHALKLGYSLSEYGLKYTKGDKKGLSVDKQFKDEKDIFEFLDQEYVPPENR